MPGIPYTAAGFPAYVPIDAEGELDVSGAEIVWAAATLGREDLAAVVAGGVLEVTWRAYLPRLCLGIDNGRFVPTELFDQLDSSEKRYISYVLGGVSARIFAARYLGVAWSVHYERYLRRAAVPIAGMRPDFVGVGIGPTHFRVAVETKGRIQGWLSAQEVEDAKEQIGRASSGRRITWVHTANLRRRAWAARLVDPSTDPWQVEAEAVLLQHYTPLAEFISSNGAELNDDAQWITASTPDRRVDIAMPRNLYRPALEQDGPGLVRILEIVDRTGNPSDQDASGLVDRVNAPRPGPWEEGRAETFTGLDQVAVRVRD